MDPDDCSGWLIGNHSPSRRVAENITRNAQTHDEFELLREAEKDIDWFPEDERPNW